LGGALVFASFEHTPLLPTGIDCRDFTFLVEAVFEGEPGSVREMVAWCRLGPPGSSVDDVDVCWSEKPEGLEGFTIRY